MDSIKFLGQRIIELRKANNVSREELAAQLGIPYTTLRNYENGLREPGHLFLTKIAKLFSVSTDYLLGLSESATAHDVKTKAENSLTGEEIDHIQKYRALDEHGIDVVDYVLDKEYERCTSIPEFFMAITRPYYITPASAGLGNPLDEPPEEELKIEDTPLHRLGDFIIGVSGDSMEPRFHDGDLVLVQKMPDIEIGEIGIFILNGESYIKQKGETGLISLNPKYKPKVVSEFDEITCCGKVLCRIEKTF